MSVGFDYFYFFVHFISISVDKQNQHFLQD